MAILTTADQARVDQCRVVLKAALADPCTCGECPTDEQIRAALALSDGALLAIMEADL